MQLGSNWFFESCLVSLRPIQLRLKGFFWVGGRNGWEFDGYPYDIPESQRVIGRCYHA